MHCHSNNKHFKIKKNLKLDRIHASTVVHNTNEAPKVSARKKSKFIDRFCKKSYATPKGELIFQGGPSLYYEGYKSTSKYCDYIKAKAPSPPKQTGAAHKTIEHFNPIIDPQAAPEPSKARDGYNDEEENNHPSPWEGGSQPSPKESRSALETPSHKGSRVIRIPTRTSLLEMLERTP